MECRNRMELIGVNRVWMRRWQKLLCSVVIHRIWMVLSLLAVCCCVGIRGEGVSQWVSSVYQLAAPHAHSHTSHAASLSSTETSYFFLFLIISLTNKTKHALLPSSTQRARHKAAEGSTFATVATCADTQPLTTPTPTVMFYKHVLNNSARPYLPNGLFVPDGAPLLFASSCLSFS